MNSIDIKSLYGLKYNPFLPNIPEEALYSLPGSQTFELRIRSMARQGGFALITGEQGLGKSKTLHKIAWCLEKVPDLAVGVMQRPQSRLGDFYRELGELFNVALSPANRYGGFKCLRERWIHHCQSTLFKPVLLIDELQDYLHFALDQAGNSRLMSEELIRTLAGHAANNLRILNQMAAELLNTAAFKSGRMVVETSPGNYQVWIHSSRPLDLVEKRYWLGKLHSDPGADPKNRWGRCPGFRNRKAKHKTPSGQYPLAKLVWVDWKRQVNIPEAKLSSCFQEVFSRVCPTFYIRRLLGSTKQAQN